MPPAKRLGQSLDGPDTVTTEPAGDTRTRKKIREAVPPPSTRAKASFDIFGFPHILSMILDDTPRSALVNLIQCSKAMFSAAAPLLYRDLRITPAQLRAIIQAGWAVPQSPLWRLVGYERSFSKTLLYCLQSVRTLHLMGYTPDSVYPVLPPNCFPDVARVVLHVDQPIALYSFPPFFQQLGSHLYIRHTDEYVRQQREVPIQALALLRSLPPSFDSVTFIVSRAYQYTAAPSCAHVGSTTRQYCNISVVLLPWTLCTEEAERKLERTMARRWVRHLQRHHLKPNHDSLSRLIGSEFTGHLGDGANMLETWLTKPYYRYWDHPPSPVEYVDFRQWLQTESTEIFTKEEKHRLMQVQAELLEEVLEASTHRLECKYLMTSSNKRDYRELLMTVPEMKAKLEERQLAGFGNRERPDDDSVWWEQRD